MNEEDERPSIMFDNRLSEYQGFFRGEEFSREAMRLACLVDGMKRITSELIITWRGASFASALPYFLVNGVVGFHEGYTKSSGEMDTREFEDAVLLLLRSRIPTLAENAQLSSKIEAELRFLSHEVASHRRAAFKPLDAEWIWKSHLSENQFKMGLPPLMKETLVTIFFAYEAFIVHTVKKKLQLTSFRTSEKSFNSRFSELFPGLLQQCWSSEEMEKWRKVRNVIVHADGLLPNGKLGNQHWLPVAGGRIFVFPEHTRNLFLLLSTNVLEMLRSLAGGSSGLSRADSESIQRKPKSE